MPRVVIERGPRSGTTFPFHKSVLIGRKAGPETQLALEHGSVSRRHATIVKVEADFMIVDLGSANGTLVNGERISKPTRLKPDDRIAVGACLLRYEADAEPPSSSAAQTMSSAAIMVHEDDTPAMHRHVVLRLSAEQDQVAGIAAAALAQTMAKRLEFLNRLGSALTEHFEQPALLDFVLGELLTLLPAADRAFILLPDPAHGTFVPHAVRTHADATSRAGDGSTPIDVAVSRTLINDAVTRREAIVVLDMQADGQYAAAESIRLLGLRSVMCAPLIYNSEVCGVLQVDSTRAGVQFGREDAALLVGIASQVALVLALSQMHARALERELMDHDLELARRIQKQFLPQRIVAPGGYTIGVEYDPALAVGGDFYDVFELAGGRIALLIGDVAGKGISAALLMARIGSDVRFQSAGRTDPREILARVNDSLESNAAEGMFATAFMLVLEPQSGQVTFSNAGHPAPLVRLPDGRTTPLGQVGGAPLGLAESNAITQQMRQLEPGAAIVLFTDGVTEALNTRSELFGTEKVEQTVASASGNAEGLKTALVDAVRRFRGKAAQADDITVLTLAREPVAARAAAGAT